MTTRSAFSLDEWQKIRQSPFWLWQLLCSQAESSVAKQTADILLSELGEPRFFPPLVRVAFRSALDEMPAPFAVSPQPDDWQTALSALRERATAAEAAQFQMSLAALGRTLIKLFGRKLTDGTGVSSAQAPFYRLEQMWRELGFQGYRNGLQQKDFTGPEWERLRHAPMQVWMQTSMIDGVISPAEITALKNLITETFPPLMYFILTETLENLDRIYQAVQAGYPKTLEDLSEVTTLIEQKLSPENAVIYKMSLLMLARDVTDVNAGSAEGGGATLKHGENYLETMKQISEALKLNNPTKISANQMPEISPKKENDVMSDSETTKSGTVADAIAVMEAEENAALSSTATENQSAETGQTPAPQDVAKTPETEANPPAAETQADEEAPESSPAAQIPVEAAPQHEVAAENAVGAVTASDASALMPEVADAAPTTETPQPQTTAKIQIPEIDEAEIEREIAGTIPSSLASFNDYKKTINVVAGDLRQLMENAAELKMQNAHALIQDMMKRVEENSFSIAVVGEFKRGKSTFINALLGKDILPSDILPCSATLNRVTFGVKPGVLIKFKDGTEDQVEINKLQDYVTKLTDESEEMATKVKEAVVSYPIPYCQNNVEIIDTPGLNDDATMTDVTLSVLPHVDAAVLVIMAQSPFSEYERAFLEDKLLTSDLGRVIFIVTAIDRLNRPEDADRVVKAIKDRIRKYVIKRAAEQFGAESEEYEVYLRKIGEPRVFPLSAWQALQAKEKADAALLSTSRFDVFENALERFLSEERGAIFLQVPTNRLLSASTEILSTFKIREGALQMHTSDFDTAYDKTFQQIEELRQRKDSEMKKVDEAARQIEFEIKPLVGQLDEAIKSTALDVIENAQIADEDVANQTAITRLAERLNAEIQAAVQTSTQKQLEKIQLLVQRGVAAEAMRWTDFSEAMNKMSSQIEGRFGGESMEMQDTTLTQGVGIVATIFGFGGAYTGYKVAGWKGAAAGAGASIGIGVGTLIAAGLVAGTFLVLPLLIVGTLAALPAGAWISRKIFGGETVKKFRENFKAKMLENLEQQINAQSIEQKIIAEVENAFKDLKSKIHSEVEATLNDTEKTLLELRTKRERNEILSETERQQLFKMRRETLKIKRRAEKLNDLLLQVTAA